MKKFMLLTLMSSVLFSGICSAVPVVQEGSSRSVWRNIGYAKTGDANVLDSNGLGGNQLKWSYVDSIFGDGAKTISTISKPFMIPLEQSDVRPKIRLRVSDASTGGAGELWLITPGDDAEFVCDINVTPDTSAAEATMGGYYAGYVTDSNSTTYATDVACQNCDTKHRMGTIIVDAQNGSYIFFVWKQIEVGIIYWDYCGY